MDTLSEVWGIGPLREKATIDSTTRNGIRSAILPLRRRYRSDRMYNVKRLKGKFATDTLYSKTSSMFGKKYAQIYSHKVGFASFYLIPEAKGDTI